MTPDEAWTDLLEKDDRNSPAEYPEMCLITKDELAGYIDTARDDARHQAGRCIVQVADGLLHDPKSDGVDGHVSVVLREIGTKLTELTTRQLEDEAMAVILTTQDNSPQ